MKHIICGLLFLCVYTNTSLAQDATPVKFLCGQEIDAQTQADLLIKKADIYKELEKQIGFESASAGGDKNFCVSRPDLNSDGIKDIIIHYGEFGTLYSGSAGTLYEGYLVNSHNDWQEVFSLYTYSNRLSITRYVNGFAILQTTTKKYCPPCNTIIDENNNEYVDNTDEHILIYDTEKSRYINVGPFKKTTKKQD